MFSLDVAPTKIYRLRTLAVSAPTKFIQDKLQYGVRPFNQYLQTDLTRTRTLLTVETSALVENYRRNLGGFAPGEELNMDIDPPNLLRRLLPTSDTIWYNHPKFWRRLLPTTNSPNRRLNFIMPFSSPTTHDPRIIYSHVN